MAVMALGWLVPNHYPPWVSFHSEAVAAAGFGLLGAAALVRGPKPVAWPAAALAALALTAVPIAQALFGKVYFWGDALMPVLYLSGFALAIVTGHRLATRADGEAAAGAFWFAVLGAALLSAGIALCQALEQPLGLLGADLAPGARPFANVAQPNHLATLLALGLVGLLALNHRGQLRGTAAVAAAGLLLFGLALTGSRTGWLQVVVIALGLGLARWRAGLQVHRGWLLLPVGLAAGVAAWHALQQTLLLAGGRALAEQTRLGTRRQHWEWMLDAILREPVSGYGWGQVSVAQARVAADHAASGEMIEHSHNIVLDLLVWNGLPLGGLVILACAWWYCRRAGSCRDAGAALMLVGIAVVVVHGLLEYALEYAYFLLPLGFMVGTVDARVTKRPAASIPRWLAAVPMAAAVGCLAWLGVAYFELEEAHRLRRLQAARIDGAQQFEPPRLPILLSHQAAFLAFAGTQAQRGLTQGQLQQMRHVSERFGYPPVLLRQALALGLNGAPSEAARVLVTLCKVHSSIRCDEGREAWAAAATSFPELRGIPYPKSEAHE